jgi:predicted enzyme related to lactoylglutathione lyase
MVKAGRAGRFVWYDLMTPDTKASARFYTAAIGWGTRAERPLMGVDGQPPYTMLTAGDTPIAGLAPLEETYWLGYVGVENVDRSVTRAQDLGAEVLFGPHDIPKVGRFAVIADPQGAAIAIFTGVEGSPAAPPFAPKPLEFSWHELATTDCSGAVGFYRAMFGWETIGEDDIAPRGAYRVFGQDGVPYGGMLQKPAGMPASAWSYYVRVADVGAAAGKVRQNGGLVINGPLEVPGGDWIAQCRDPLGAMFAVHQTAP